MSEEAAPAPVENQTAFTLDIKAGETAQISFEGNEDRRVNITNVSILGDATPEGEVKVIAIYEESLEDGKEPEKKEAVIATFTAENKDLQDTEFNCGVENKTSIKVDGNVDIQISGVYYEDGDDEEEEKAEEEKKE